MVISFALAFENNEGWSSVIGKMHSEYVNDSYYPSKI